jgi:hypothetical protein
MASMSLSSPQKSIQYHRCHNRVTTPTIWWALRQKAISATARKLIEASDWAGHSLFYQR